MEKALLVAVLASAFFSLVFSELQSRVYHGREAEENEFPYMVNVQTGFVRCGGALLSNRYVLTAGHCLNDALKGTKFTLVLGGRSFKGDESNRVNFTAKKNENFWIHENFSLPSAADDLAVIQLPQPVELSEKIKTIKVSTDEKIDQKQQEVVTVFMGYGATEEGSSRSQILKTATMKLIPISDCSKYQPHYIENITTNHICAFGEGTREGHGVGPCDGDSGSPLVLAETDRLIGITSFVKDAEDGQPLAFNDCNTHKAPAVYVRVASYLDWISEKTGIRFE